jgi:hypothetical protein
MCTIDWEALDILAKTRRSWEGLFRCSQEQELMGSFVPFYPRAGVHGNICSVLSKSRSSWEYLFRSIQEQEFMGIFVSL